LYSNISNTSIFDDPSGPRGNRSSESNSKSSSESGSLVTVIVIVVVVLMGLPIIAFIIFFIVRYKSQKNKSKSFVYWFLQEKKKTIEKFHFFFLEISPKQIKTTNTTNNNMTVTPASNTHLIDTSSSQMTQEIIGNNGEDGASEQYDQISVDHNYNFIENNYYETNNYYEANNQDYSNFQILPISNAINPTNRTSSPSNEHLE
jgi:hypothetical protein